MIQTCNRSYIIEKLFQLTERKNTVPEMNFAHEVGVL